LSNKVINNMNHPVSYRIRLFSEKRGLSQYRLAQVIGVSKQAVSKIFLDKNDVTAATLTRIVLNYPELNPRWLLTGQGPMLLEGGAHPAHPATHPAQGGEKVAENEGDTEGGVNMG
jgi:DNA-binding XRE family transcriptional regulator